MGTQAMQAWQDTIAMHTWYNGTRWVLVMLGALLDCYITCIYLTHLVEKMSFWQESSMRIVTYIGGFTVGYLAVEYRWLW